MVLRWYTFSCIYNHACTQHEKLSQKVFKEMIYDKRLRKEFERYGITEEDVEIITDLIHYKPKKEKFLDIKKVFLYQVCEFIVFMHACTVNKIISTMSCMHIRASTLSLHACR